MPLSTSRAVENQQIQWGFDATPRAGGGANRKFSELIVMPGITGEAGVNRGQGAKGGVTSVTRGVRRTTAKFDGPWNFNDLIAIFANHGNYAAPSVHPDEASARLWRFSPSLITVNTPKTGILQWGDNVLVDQADYMLTHALKLEASRAADGLKMSGEMMGSKPFNPRPGGFTATPTRYAQATASSVDVNCYLVDDLADLDTGTDPIVATPLPRAYKWSMDNKGMWVPDDPLNSARKDFEGMVEGPQSTTIKYTMQADADGMALYDTLDEGQLKYFGIYVEGPALGDTFYSFKFMQALKITKVPDYSDIDNIHGIEIEAEPALDSDFNNMLYVAEIVSALTAL